MVSRSGWAQNVAFDVTERRFSYRDPLAENPAPGTYQPKTNIADAIPKQNVRAGPFGSNKKRFEVPKPAYIPTKEQNITGSDNPAPMNMEPTTSSGILLR